MSFTYVAIDGETTARNPKDGLLLSLCMILDRIGSKKDINTLPMLNIIIKQPNIYGEPAALSMNYDLIKRTKAGTPRDTEQLVEASEVAEAIGTFMKKHQVDNGDLVVAGKNPSFDVCWIKSVMPTFKCHYRMIDPTILYMKLQDIAPPNLAICLERAGIQQGEAHNQMCDAVAVIQLLRRYFGR